jgi:hypothetical protein
LSSAGRKRVGSHSVNVMVVSGAGVGGKGCGVATGAVEVGVGVSVGLPGADWQDAASDRVAKTKRIFRKRNMFNRMSVLCVNALCERHYK